MSLLVPVLIPAGSQSLPPLDGRLFAVYRAAWWLVLAGALAAVLSSWIAGMTPLEILALRFVKSIVLVSVSIILFRRRCRDPVAAMLSTAFLLWTISSSIDFASDFGWWPLIDRCRFLFFALALLLFPDGQWRPRWTRAIAGTIIATFLLGVAETVGILATRFYLPVAIICVLAAIGALLARFRAIEAGTQKQQLKWVILGLVTGVALILSARAAAKLTSGLAMPLSGTLAIEGLFQLGIIVLSLGFLTSLLRYRLYDAETAISRSAAYAGLTLALVAVFAGSESIIQTIGQRYFGQGIGDLSGGIAAAVAAVLLTPLHSRISNWAEIHFQRDLTGLKSELPELLSALSGGSSVGRIGLAVLPLIEKAVHATRIALVVDGKPVASRGIARSSVKRLLSRWKARARADMFDQDDDRDFPIRMALRSPRGRNRGWLLLGPRPDGSIYGTDDLDALAAIASPLQQTILAVAERENERRSTKSRLGKLEAKLKEFEAVLMASRAQNP